MKNSFIIILSILSFCAFGQTRQNINRNTGTVSNVLTTIDSIRFNGSSTNMEVLLQNGTVESHSISDIVNVNFISANQHNCGATNVHNPNLTYGSMTDQEGNVYKTIVIGTQEWMAENLNTSHYRHGDLIPNVTDYVQWQNLSTGAWAFYNNDSQYVCPYGKLYNWYAVNDPSNLCPESWHIPSDAEWSTLTDYLGGATIAGRRMKTTGIQYWISPNGNATNESGFSGLPYGSNGSDGFFVGIGDHGIWWSSTENESYYAWTRFLISEIASTVRGSNSKRDGFSVRCLKD